MNHHTAGPWSWYRGRTLLNSRDDVVLEIDLPEFISDADKRLIAAAPDLLAAAKAISEQADTVCPGDVLDLHALYVAIAKAEHGA